MTPEEELQSFVNEFNGELWNGLEFLNVPTIEAPMMNGVPWNDYYKTEYWQKLSTEAKCRDEFKCVQCKRRTYLQVHHKSYKNCGNWEKELNDLVTLCRSCHEQVHVLKMFTDCE
jgi:hypothetical protein